MSLTGLRMSEEVWLTCLNHALTTEAEEIMGLLLGDIEYKSGSTIANVWYAAPQTRSDRRKDRVETNPEQLAAASALAERMTVTSGITTRVIGWYHSHPHITVLPSHVDVRTQGMYQLLDPGFVGVIFSCFSEDAQKAGRIQVMAFQSLDAKQKHLQRVPIHIEAEASRTTLGSSISKLTPKSPEIIDLDPVVPKATFGSSKSRDSSQSAIENFFDNADVPSPSRRDKTISPSTSAYYNENSRSSDSDLDSMDLTSRMQEAVHRSSMDVSGADFVRKEIPFQVVSSHQSVKQVPLDSYVDLQRVLFTEEHAAFNQAMTQSTRNGKVHPLAAIHHTSTYQASMCKLMEHCLSPAISSLWDRLDENKLRLSFLKDEEQSLKEIFSKEKQSGQSPRRMPNSISSEVTEQKHSMGSPSNARRSSVMAPQRSPNR